MRILGLDHGTRRVGVAVSDEMHLIAQPLEYIAPEPFADFLKRLKEILAEREVGLILIGMPRNMDGSYGEAAAKVREAMPLSDDEVEAVVADFDALRRGVTLPSRDRR